MRFFLLTTLLPAIALAKKERKIKNIETFDPLAILPRQAEFPNGLQYIGINMTSYHGKHCKKEAGINLQLFNDVPRFGNIGSYNLSRALGDNMHMQTFDDLECEEEINVTTSVHKDCYTFDRNINCFNIIVDVPEG